MSTTTATKTKSAPKAEKKEVQTNEQVLEQFGLNWTVQKTRLHTMHNGKQVDSPYFGNMRSDNGTVIGVCKDRYQVRQNSEILDSLKTILDTDELKIMNGGIADSSFRSRYDKISGGGCFKDGSKVFFQVEIPSTKIGKDTVKKYLFALSSHDGSCSLSLGTTSKVMSCQNMFNRFLKDSTIKIRHTESIGEKSNEYAKELGLYVKAEQELYDKFRIMNETKVRKGLIKEMMYDLTYTDTKLDPSELSTRKTKMIESLEEVIKSEMKEKGQTLWGLFNGVTYYANHIKTTPKKEGGKLESILIGGGNHMMNKALDLILDNELK